MFFIFASTFGSSARISASPGIDGPGVTVPSIRPPFPILLLAVPVVLVPLAPPVAAPSDPDEFAVPEVLVPGAVGAYGARDDPGARGPDDGSSCPARLRTAPP
jgi:hypothetical protein